MKRDFNRTHYDCKIQRVFTQNITASNARSPPKPIVIETDTKKKTPRRLILFARWIIYVFLLSTFERKGSRLQACVTTDYNPTTRGGQDISEKCKNNTHRTFSACVTQTISITTKVQFLWRNDYTVVVISVDSYFSWFTHRCDYWHDITPAVPIFFIALLNYKYT